MSLTCIQYKPFTDSGDESDWIEIMAEPSLNKPKEGKPQKHEMIECKDEEHATASKSLFVGTISTRQKEKKEEEKYETIECCEAGPITPSGVSWVRNKPELFYDAQATSDGESDNDDEAVLEETTKTMDNDIQLEASGVVDWDTNDTHERECSAGKELVEEISELKQVNLAVLAELQAARDQLHQMRIQYEQQLDDMKIELLAATQQRDDVEKKLATKEQALERARGEVETLKKVIHQNTFMVTMQRNHAVSAMTEKDRILQNYKEKINLLKDELNEIKRREQVTAKSFGRELQLLQESLAAVETPQSSNDNDDGEGDDEDDNENRTLPAFSLLSGKHTTPDSAFTFDKETKHDKENDDNGVLEGKKPIVRHSTILKVSNIE